MPEVDLDLRPLVEAQRPRADVSAERVQLVGREHAASLRLAARDPLELAELLEGVDADVRVGADAERYRAPPNALGGQEAVAEVRLGGRTGADRRPGRRNEVELGAVGVGGVHDRRAAGQAADAIEELDRSAPVLRQALLDLLRL